MKKFVSALIAVFWELLPPYGVRPPFGLPGAVVLLADIVALFLLTGAEFLGMILLVVYVGAVAVLFLTVFLVLPLMSGNQPSAASFMVWLALTAIAVAVFIWFCKVKTEGEWRWRWGNPAGEK